MKRITAEMELAEFAKKFEYVDNWNKFKKWFGSDEKKMETIIDNAYSIINGKTNKSSYLA